MINELTDDETFVQSFSRTQSLTSTLDLQLISDDTLDELFFDTDSPLELTHNNLNEVNRRNAMSVSNYIYNQQLPAGVNELAYLLSTITGQSSLFPSPMEQHTGFYS
ncbi:hypothetical protein DAPPUDRAFT_317912 [Daphnia pulex]|uniref:Uncharacterized protein n=1 Tax=Daphnia pulex TaxID=6669 RepID=E9GHB6_DAPPU|nr:hypothetical protein DAPPUDRAFT_317912 [Daphnia pulex]|eukprot:EFX81207.1 hypothetical protein DAPPUDRAFT_317912 [Daphnia pulex]